jgi:hypothetical protein
MQQQKQNMENRPNEATYLKIQLSNAKPNTKGIYEKFKGPSFMLKIANMQRNKSTIFWDTMPYSPFN